MAPLAAIASTSLSSFLWRCLGLPAKESTLTRGLRLLFFDGGGAALEVVPLDAALEVAPLAAAAPLAATPCSLARRGIGLGIGSQKQA